MLPTLSIRQVPFLRMAVLMIMGMTLTRLFGNGSFVSSLSIASLIILLLAVQHVWKWPLARSILLNLNIVLLGGLLLSVSMLSKRVSPLVAECLSSKTLKIIEIEEYTTGDKYHTLYGSILGTSEEKINLHNGSAMIKAKVSGPLAIKRGALIGITSSLQPIKSKELANGFNYGQYLMDQGYTFQGFTNQENLIRIENVTYPYWKKIRYHVRNNSIAVIDKHLSGDAKHITKALVLGDRSGLDNEIRSKFADSGIIHILAVSGLHIGIIALLLFQFINKALWWLKPYAFPKTAFIIIGLILFAELSGGSPTVWRAVIMTSTYFISKSLNRRSHPLNLLGIAAIVILIFKPTDLFSVSFQLSFSAVAGILLFSPWLFKLAEFNGRALNLVWGIIVIGISAQVGTLPFTLYYFHQLPILSPIAGIIAIPAAYGIMSTGLLMIITNSFLPVLSNFLSRILGGLIKGLNYTAEFINSIPYSLIQDVWITPFESILITLAILCSAGWLYMQRRYLFQLSLALICVSVTSHFLIQEYNYTHTQEIVYQTDPVSIDIISHGRCLHYNENPNKPISDYLTADIRSKYRVKEIIKLDKTSLAQLKLEIR